MFDMILNVLIFLGVFLVFKSFKTNEDQIKKKLKKFRRWERRLYYKYPEMLDGMVKSARDTCMCFGFDVGNGWRKLIENLLKELGEFSKQNHFSIKILQVKEKLGGLRVYIRLFSESKRDLKSTFDEVYNIIYTTEDKSYEICEVCGKPGGTSKGGWKISLCPKHMKQWEGGKRFPTRSRFFRELKFKIQFKIGKLFRKWK
jgi:hypothetical protein